MREKLKTVFVCTNCGEVAPKWSGKCPSCNEWNTMAEDVVKTSSTKGASLQPKQPGRAATKLIDVSAAEENMRLKTLLPEFDRVLGGGIVLGSVILLGGEPGSGKSTLLLQACNNVAQNKKVLYITGEESIHQIKIRAIRLGATAENLLVAASTDIDDVCGMINDLRPQLVVIDSIQTMKSDGLSSSQGSVSQVKECTALLIESAKQYAIPIFLVGHVNKDGAIAGPKVLEHMVDTVLYFEGDRSLPYRVLRTAKNRYGSANEIGMFDMTSKGLVEVTNPSAHMLEGRPLDVSGNCITCTVEGSRAILTEVQALSTKTGFGTPRRAATGVDFNRVNLLLAVVEKRGGYFLGNIDIYINIVGGLELDDTACDLAVALSLISSLTDMPVDENVVAIGELGLGGEVRAITNIEMRLREMARLGFKKALIPYQNFKKLNKPDFNIEIIGVQNIRDAMRSAKA